MSLSSLFRKSEWKKLRAFPPDMQRDVAYLLAFDTLIKGAVSEAIERVQAHENGPPADTCRELRKALSQDWFSKELELAILSTGAGKTLSAIPWVYTPPERVVWVLGMLAMCENRYGEQLTNQPDLSYSGYSAHPDEARTQLLVLIAKQCGIQDLQQLRAFDERFWPLWESLRETIFFNMQQRVSGEVALPSSLESRFQQLSKARKLIVLSVAGSFLSRDRQREQSASLPKKARSVEELQKQHPFKFVPYTSLVNEMVRLAHDIDGFFNDLPIDDVELRRNIGAERQTADDKLAEIVTLDSETAAYCIVVAVVVQMEPTFVGCGVWKKLTETYQARNERRRLSAAMLNIPTPLGAAEAELDAWKKKIATRSLNMLEKARLSPNEYVQTRGRDKARLPILLGATTVLRHVLKHPRHGKALESFLSQLISSVTPRLAALRSGELLTWDEQQKLSV